MRIDTLNAYFYSIALSSKSRFKLLIRRCVLTHYVTKICKLYTFFRDITMLKHLVFQDRDHSFGKFRLTEGSSNYFAFQLISTKKKIEKEIHNINRPPKFDNKTWSFHFNTDE